MMAATPPSNVTTSGTEHDPSAFSSPTIKYALPIDEEESKRLDLQHHIFHLSLEGKLNLAPLGPELHNVLDVGTGTGFWAIDFAKLHPETNVIGTDISALEKPQSFLRDDLPNLSFQLANAEEEWDFGTEFDYIHARMMQISFDDSEAVFGSAFKALRPGGWLEMQDINATAMSDDGSAEGSAIAGWYIRQNRLGKARGRPWNNAPNYQRYMEEVGFEDIHVEIKYWPFGGWMEDQRMKEIGKWLRINQIEAVRAFSRGKRIEGWTKEDDEAEIVAMEKEMREAKVHVYIPLYIVWGRKPLE